MQIYFDNASTTPLYPEVADVMYKIIVEDFGNPSSIHRHGRKAKALVEHARKIVAHTINSSISEIFFTSSATEANNMILKNAVYHHGIEYIISSPTEHHCVLNSLHYLETFKNIHIKFLDVDDRGNPDLSQLESLLAQNKKTALVSLMHGNNEIGTMTDIMKVGELCHKYKSLFHCDAVQTVGKYVIDTQRNHIAFLTGSAHKFHGPKGSGFVYINNQNILQPFIHGGAQERNMRAGTENVAGIVGLATALEKSTTSMAIDHQKKLSLRNRFKKLIEEQIEDIRFNGNQDQDFLAHILSISFPAGPKADMLVMNLDINGISASSGSACSAGIEEDSHVLRAINHPKERKTIRFSFSPFNTPEEIDYTVAKIKTIM